MKTAIRLTLTLMLCTILCLFLGSEAFADTIASGTCGTEGDNVTWSLDEEGMLTISGARAMADYAKPSDAPYFNEDVYAVVVEEGVTGIGKNAFAGMFLDNVMLPDSLAGIGENAFQGAGITEAHFVGNLKQWNDNIIVAEGNAPLLNIIKMDQDVTFDGDGLHLADGVLLIDHTEEGYSYVVTSTYRTEYGPYTFEVEFAAGTSVITEYAITEMVTITSVSIPDSLMSIGYGAFRGCSALAAVCISDLESWCKISYFVPENDDLLCLDCEDNPLFWAKNLYLNGDLVTELMIPDGITEIRSFAFSGCTSLTSIIIPDSVLYIGEHAFSYCSGLDSLAIPDSMISIGEYAFSYCSGFDSLAIPNNLTSIGEYAFSYCRGLKNVVIPNSLTSIGAYVFYECAGLKSAGVVGSGCDYEFNWTTTIPDYAFSGCTGLTDVIIPDSVTSIGLAAFQFCRELTNIYIPYSVTSINDYAFQGCSSLESISIPERVMSIGEKTFWYCSSLTDVTIGNSVTSIGDWAFRNCSRLRSIYIPASITSVGQEAFYGCPLADIYYDGIIAMWNTISIAQYNESLTSATIHCLAIDGGTTGDCCWLLYDTGLLKITGQGSMADYIEGNAPWYAYCNQTTDIQINPCVNSIGNYAFFGLTELKCISGMEMVSKIGTGVFNNCSALESFCISANVTNMGENAFSGCALLTSAGPIGSGATIEFGWAKTIPANAFSGADCLQTLTIPEGVTRIMAGAVKECTALSSVSLPTTLTAIQQNTFSGCESLAEISLSEGLKTIGVAAFKDTTLLSVTIPLSIKSIGNNAFDGSALTDVYYPGSRNQWNTITLGTDNSALNGAALHFGSFDINMVSTNGSVVVEVNNEAVVTAVEGDVVMLRITPDAGYVFDTLSVKQGETDVVVTSNSFTMPAGDVMVTATFIVAPVFGNPTFTLPTATKHIEESAFEGVNALTIVEIPSGCESIGKWAFKDCTSLTQIRIPASVTTIDTTAFDGCANVLVYGTARSTAETFAKANGFTFIEET